MPIDNLQGGRQVVNIHSLSAEGHSEPVYRVPRWSVGTVRRRSITFATGLCDTQTAVAWVQSHGMTGDIRIHPARPELSPDTRLGDLDHESLCRLASVEGGVAKTSWSAGLMSWDTWIGFQAYDKYPEPGILHRIGDCMIELAPSGIYVEDWRFQASAPGLVAGLELLGEISADGVEHPRSGGLVVAGDYAVLSLARRRELPAGVRAQDFVRTSPQPLEAIEQVFDCTVDFAKKGDGTLTIELSTDPRRQGGFADWLDGFSPSKDSTRLHQTVRNADGEVKRVWRVASFEQDVSFPLATSVAHEHLAWLAAEADTLIDPIRTAAQRSEREFRCA